MQKIFGTDGIRGLANVYPMTVATALQVGRAIAFLIRKEGSRQRIVIGKDTRLSGYMLENALAAGICSMGVDVLLVGPLPTPGIAFITKSMRADAGVVISASHNPYFDNGIKIFDKDGYKLPDEMEAEIEHLIADQKMDAVKPTGDEVGRAKRIDDAKGRYIVFLKNTFPQKYTLEGVHIVLDCAHGATYGVSPHVFEELGAKVTAIGVSPNGININDNRGALYPEQMALHVKKVGADIGIALDGDGDRLIVCDENGEVLSGDHVMAICARDLISKRKLKKKTLVGTVMSNMGLERAMKEMGGELIRVDVGDRHVVESMRKNGYSFGGEQSGHLVYHDHISTGDGTLAGLQILAIMQKQGKRLSELATIMESMPQVLKNVRIASKLAADSIVGFTSLLADCEKELAGRGRILVRTSGTEPLIRVMAEGEDLNEIENIVDRLCDHIISANV
ncbi:MAG: phosphoglucosamine mutase [Desulfotalea sp.]